MGDKPFLGLETWIPAVRWICACTANSVRTRFDRRRVAGGFLIPELLAYASLAQLPPVTGLYCYLVAGIAYALFGTSRQLAVGPTSALAIVIATSVVAMGDGDAGRAVALASALALIVGIVSVAGRFVGLPTSLISYRMRFWSGSKPALRCISRRRNCRSFSASKA